MRKQAVLQNEHIITHFLLSDFMSQSTFYSHFNQQASLASHFVVGQLQVTGKTTDFSY